MRGRKPGGKNSDGLTRSMILVWIANKPGVSTEDLWGFLHSRKDPRCRMSTINQLYIHLRWLRKNGFIDSTRHTRTEDQKHTVKSGFEHFINAYNFITSHDLKQDLTNSAYYRQYTELNNFMTRYTVYRLKDNLLKINAYITHDGKINRKHFITAFRTLPANTEASLAEYQELIKTLQSHSVDELIPIINSRIHANQGNTIIGPDFLSSQALQNVNKREDQSLQAMLREQPSVIDFLINTKHYDPILLHNIIIRLLPTQGINDNGLKIAMDYADSPEPAYFNIIGLIEKWQGHCIKDESALYQIIRSLALWDLISGKIQKLPVKKPKAKTKVAK